MTAQPISARKLLRETLASTGYITVLTAVGS